MKFASVKVAQLEDGHTTMNLSSFSRSSVPSIRDGQFYILNVIVSSLNMREMPTTTSTI